MKCDSSWTVLGQGLAPRKCSRSVRHCLSNDHYRLGVPSENKTLLRADGRAQTGKRPGLQEADTGLPDASGLAVAG